MSQEQFSYQQAATRLIQALSQQDNLTCEQAWKLLPIFVETQRADPNMEAAPEYVALIRHLDDCEECRYLNDHLTECLNALTGEAEILPMVRPAPPTFFALARYSEGIALRVLRGLMRQFELTLQIPSLTPVGATLGGGKRTNLFSDNLTEIAGSPLISIMLYVEEDASELLVAIRETTIAHWQVQVIIGEIIYTAATDERGIARFSNFPVSSLQQLVLSCAELPSRT